MAHRLTLPGGRVVSTRAGVRRVIPLTLGWEELPITVSIHTSHGPIPTCACANRCRACCARSTAGGCCSTPGFNAPLVRDPILYQRFHRTA